jgi:hypothetical protein
MKSRQIVGNNVRGQRQCNMPILPDRWRNGEKVKKYNSCVHNSKMFWDSTTVGIYRV